MVLLDIVCLQNSSNSLQTIKEQFSKAINAEGAGILLLFSQIMFVVKTQAVPDCVANVNKNGGRHGDNKRF